MLKHLTRQASYTWATLCLVGAMGGLPSAHAGVDSVISFAQPGQVDIILTSNAGGFDHLMEPVLVGGNAPFWAYVPYTGAWMVGTENGSLLTLVGNPNSPFSPTAFNYNWGYFDVEAGQEISLRLTNIWTDRIGGVDPDLLGTIHSQVFAGSGAVNNTLFSGGSVAGGTPGAPDPGALLGGGYTFVTFVSPTQIDIGFTDLDPTRPDPFMNMTVTLLLTPVPEPGSLALLLAGLAAVGQVVRRRVH